MLDGGQHWAAHFLAMRLGGEWMDVSGTERRLRDDSCDAVCTFREFVYAQAAIKQIDSEFSTDMVTGLSYIMHGETHIVVACTRHPVTQERLYSLMAELNGVKSSLTLSDAIALPDAVLILGSAGDVIDLLGQALQAAERVLGLDMGRK
jgi:hypothetical protein